MTKQTVLNQLYRGIIVSCQALPGEPLHGRGMMAAMAQAAKEGGAVGIRANGVEDIAAIRRQVALPVIGIVKAEYPGSPVYITPTEAEVEALLQAGAEIVALDATARPRPQGQSLEEFFLPLRQRHPGQLFMADCATLERPGAPRPWASTWWAPPSAATPRTPWAPPSPACPCWRP